MRALPKPSPAEYLEQERMAETKSEYIAGEIFAMAGASPEHNLIVGNLIRELGNALKKRPCRVYPSDLRVQAAEGYFYPDVTVVCGTPRFSDRDNLINPSLIVEVLSSSTADFDMGGKFVRYRQIDSLLDYLLVSQERAHLIHYYRQDANHWLMTEITDPNAEVELPGVDCRLSLVEIYDKVFIEDGS
jgi:Uma2 family endonuclease